LTIHSIAIADPPLRSSYGRHAPYALRTILELKSDDGIIGLAENSRRRCHRPGLSVSRATAAWRRSVSHRRHASALIEEDPKAAGLDRSQTFHVPGENPLDEAARLLFRNRNRVSRSDRTIRGPVGVRLLGGRRGMPCRFPHPFYKHAGGGGEGADAREDILRRSAHSRSVWCAKFPDDDRVWFSRRKAKRVLDPENRIEPSANLRAALGPSSARLVQIARGRLRLRSRRDARARRGTPEGGYLEIPPRVSAEWLKCGAVCLPESIATPLASNVACDLVSPISQRASQRRGPIVLCDPHYWGRRASNADLGKSAAHLDSAYRCIKFASRCFADGHGPRRRRNAAPFLRLRHALSLAIGNKTKWRPAPHPIREWLRAHPDRPGLGVELRLRSSGSRPVSATRSARMQSR